MCKSHVDTAVAEPVKIRVLFLFVLLSGCLICDRSLHYSGPISSPVARNNRKEKKKNASPALIVTILWHVALNVHEQDVTIGTQNLSYLSLKYWDYIESKREYESVSFDGVISVLKTWVLWLIGSGGFEMFWMPLGWLLSLLSLKERFAHVLHPHEHKSKVIRASC